MIARTRLTMRTLLTTVVCLVPALFLASQQSRDAATTPVTSAPTGTAVISGTVVADDATSAPVRRVTVSLAADDPAFGKLVATTDDAGAFAFAGLPAGRYSLSAAKGGHLWTSYGAKRPGGAGLPIELSNGQRASGLTIKLLKGSVITGVVRDDDGHPVPGVTVAALHYAMSYMGERELQGADSPTQQFGDKFVTDDRGQYRIFMLPPGDYIVSASAPARPNEDEFSRLGQEGADIHQITDADIRRAEALLAGGAGADASAPIQPGTTPPPVSTVATARVYFPAALSAADATTITLGPHEERPGVDIQLHLVPTARVEGTTIGPDGIPLANVALVMANPGTSASGVTQSALRNARSDRNGKFVMPGLGPGTYQIVAYGPLGQISRVGGGDAPDSIIHGLVDVTVNGRDVTTSITLTPGVTVSGRVVFEGRSPPNPATVSLILRRNPSLFGGGTGFTMTPDGAFAYLSVPPGNYRLMVNGRPPAGWILESATWQGRDIADVPFEVTPNESIDGIVLTFSDQRAEISGTFQDAAGDPAPQYTIVVFSANQQSWMPRSRFTQTTRPGADGKFVIRDLPPGDYLMSAVTDIEDGQWNDPAFLADLAAHQPIRITLAEGEKKVQDIKIGGG